jgi:ATP-binding cassette subfamily F protein uup
MPVLDVTDLKKIIAGRTLFEDVTFTIRRGEKIGLVGHNGSGKSTLGRVLAGLDEPDGGRISRRREATFDYLEQEPHFAPGRTIREVVLEGLAGWAKARRDYDALTEALGQATGEAELSRLAEKQAALGEAIERQGGWEREHEAETIVSHLGIADPTRQVETLSGGEARRVALARLLVAEPDLAILDEPTNHLDVETIEWLEEFLRDRWKGALLLISHDREVLDAVTTRTLELHDGTVHDYDGGYGRYLLAKAEREAHAHRTERNRQNFLRREVEWLRRQPKARGTKQKARTSRAESALGQSAPREERQAELKMSSERQGKTILEAKGLVIERGGRRLIDNLNLALSPGQRIGIAGANGSGKTTLLLTLLGELQPAAGEIVLGSNTKIGYLDQARSNLNDDDTVREAAVGDATQVQLGEESLSAGSYLERFLFDRPKQRLRVGELSGGERARVCLARLLAQKCNLLILDEPTNDLDVSTLSALESMLLDFGGCVLIVSHDRWLLDRVATSILGIEGDGQVDLQVGGYSDYKARRPKQSPSSSDSKGVAREANRGGKGGAAPETASSKTVKPRPSGVKKLTHAERIELDGLFERIEEAEASVAALGEQLADPATYQGDPEEAVRLRAELDAATAEAAKLSARWEELEARDAASPAG